MKQEYTTDPETGEQIPVSDYSYGFSDGTKIQVYAMTQEEYDAFMRLYGELQQHHGLQPGDQ